MGTLYTPDKTRSDWGRVNNSLREGFQVHIRPATAKELEWAEKELVDFKEKFGSYNDE